MLTCTKCNSFVIHTLLTDPEQTTSLPLLQRSEPRRKRIEIFHRAQSRLCGCLLCRQILVGFCGRQLRELRRAYACAPRLRRDRSRVDGYFLLGFLVKRTRLSGKGTGRKRQEIRTLTPPSPPSSPPASSAFGSELAGDQSTPYPFAISLRYASTSSFEGVSTTSLLDTYTGCKNR